MIQDLPIERPWALALGTKCSWSIARWTRARVAGRTDSIELIARLTVAIDTPAAWATS